VYVMGAGRSGTTILGIILGDNAGIAHVGEINKFLTFSGKSPGRDEKSKVCMFFSDVYEEILDEGCDIDFDYKKEEFHLHLLRFVMCKKKNKCAIKYLYKQKIVFDKLYEKLGASVIVDSSKYSVRAFRLMNISSYDVKLIYLKRSYLGVVKSFQKKKIEQPRKGYLSASIYYLIVNFLAYIVFCLYDKKNRLFVRYEDILTDPEGVLIKIKDGFDVDISNSLEKIREKIPLRTGYIFDGNRVRLQDDIMISK